MGNGGSRGRTRTGSSVSVLPETVPVVSSPHPTAYASTEQRNVIERMARTYASLPNEFGGFVAADGREFGSVAGGAREIHLEPHQAEAGRGADFLHNHPGGDSLNPVDIQTAVHYGFSGIHATTRQSDGSTVLYTARPGPQGWSQQVWENVLRESMDHAQKATLMWAASRGMRGPDAQHAADAVRWHRAMSLVAREHPEHLVYTWQVIKPSAS